MVCCCFRFRIPRTKQQIEADYQRRKITSKFRQELETIQDAKMDSMSLKDGRYYANWLPSFLRSYVGTVQSNSRRSVLHFCRDVASTNVYTDVTDGSTI